MNLTDFEVSNNFGVFFEEVLQTLKIMLQILVEVNLRATTVKGKIVQVINIF